MSRNLPEGYKKVSWTDLGIRLVYQLSENRLEGEYADIRYKDFDAVIQDSRTFEVYGVVEIGLAQALGTWYTNRAYATALEGGNEESAALGALLSTTCSCVAEAFSKGRTIANLGRLEMLPDTRMKGYGVEIATRVLSLVRQRYGMVAFLIQPFPLQYRKGAPALDDKARARSWARFGADKSKLIRLYENAWGAQHLSDVYMVASLSHKVSVTRHARKWRLMERLATN